MHLKSVFGEVLQEPIAGCIGASHDPLRQLAVDITANHRNDFSIAGDTTVLNNHLRRVAVASNVSPAPIPPAFASVILSNVPPMPEVVGRAEPADGICHQPGSVLHRSKVAALVPVESLGHRGRPDVEFDHFKRPERRRSRCSLFTLIEALGVIHSKRQGRFCVDALRRNNVMRQEVIALRSQVAERRLRLRLSALRWRALQELRMELADLYRLNSDAVLQRPVLRSVV